MDVAVELKGVSYRYGNQEKDTLSDITLSVRRGACVVITGSAGSGKSTLCHCLNGLIPQALEGDLRGSLSVAGKNPAAIRVQAMARQTGLVMQDPETQIVGRTGYEDVAFGPRNFLVPRQDIHRRVTQSLEQVGLRGYENQSPDTLSGGEKQRLAMAGVLAMEPDILVLDEPASELDPAGRRNLYGMLDGLRREKSTTLIMVEQKLRDIHAMVDTVFVLDSGRISWQGSPDEYLKTQAAPPQRPVTSTASKPVSKMDQGCSRETDAALSAPILQIRDLNFSYPGSGPILRDINLDIHGNDFLALAGHNGAGKTSLAKHLNGLFPAPPQTIHFEGRDISSMNRKELSQKVGFVFQNPDHQIFETTVEKELEFGLRTRGMGKPERKERVRETLRFMGLEAYATVHPFTLGKGMRQMIAVASIVALNPRILVVDEPTTGLDASGCATIMGIIKKLHNSGTAIVCITHDMELIRKYANRAVVLNRGRIVQNKPKDTVSGSMETEEDTPL
ncbi:MAG: ABC transporter ATP-binding protein [Desulfobacteraceae bacterium]|nr:ABC transporter ATP-binding protein [Desulfobacteraceae bacterium]